MADLHLTSISVAGAGAAAVLLAAAVQCAVLVYVRYSYVSPLKNRFAPFKFFN